LLKIDNAANKGNRMYLTDQGMKQLLNLSYVTDSLSLERWMNNLPCTDL